MSEKFWIDETEQRGSDLVLFVSCFGARRARFIADRLAGVDRCKVKSTEFIEIVEQECDGDGGLTTDEHYILDVLVPDVTDEQTDAEFDRITETLEGIFSQ